jgi:hypothetical protein
MSKATSIQLTKAEIQSGHDRVRWAEGLIRQLPADHEGRNSWLFELRARARCRRAAQGAAENQRSPVSAGMR